MRETASSRKAAQQHVQGSIRNGSVATLKMLFQRDIFCWCDYRNLMSVRHSRSSRKRKRKRRGGRGGGIGASRPRHGDGALRQTVVDLKEGYAYVSAPGNREVLAFVLIRPSGNLIWGACDVLYVK